MNDQTLGKYLVEEMVLERLLESFPILSGRTITEEAARDIPQLRDPPDFVVGVDGVALGIELTQIRNADDAWEYCAKAHELAWKKHENYLRRGLFRLPMALILHSDNPPLYDMKDQLATLEVAREFEDTGFAEVWAIDFSDAYFSDGHPFRRPDMFCFKPVKTFGFHRVGNWGRKPFG